MGTFTEVQRVVVVGPRVGMATGVVVGLDPDETPEDCCRPGEEVLEDEECLMELPDDFPVGQMLQVEG